MLCTKGKIEFHAFLIFSDRGMCNCIITYSIYVRRDFIKGTKFFQSQLFLLYFSNTHNIQNRDKTIEEEVSRSEDLNVFLSCKIRSIK
jgi:hypothetical protein